MGHWVKEQASLSIPTYGKSPSSDIQNISLVPLVASKAKNDFFLN